MWYIKKFCAQRVDRVSDKSSSLAHYCTTYAKSLDEQLTVLLLRQRVRTYVQGLAEVAVLLDEDVDVEPVLHGNCAGHTHAGQGSRRHQDRDLDIRTVGLG